MTPEEKEKVASQYAWANSHIRVNKETFETDVDIPADKLVMVPVGEMIKTAVLYGMNLFPRNVWHDVTDEPQEEKAILLTRQFDSVRVFDIGLYNASSKKVYINNDVAFPWKKLSFYNKWMYLDDLILPTE